MLAKIFANFMLYGFVLSICGLFIIGVPMMAIALGALILGMIIETIKFILRPIFK